jgi:cytochrome b6-f complex iron-sulfur subunit
MQAGRRNFLKILAGGLSALWVAAIAYPVLRYLKRPAVDEAEVTSVVVAQKGDLKPGESKTFKFGNRPGLLICKADNQYVAMDATCTHLACIAQHRPAQKDIYCACHGGVYTLDGANASGPPPRPLAQLKVDVAANGQVTVKKA